MIDSKLEKIKDYFKNSSYFELCDSNQYHITHKWIAKQNHFVAFYIYYEDKAVDWDYEPGNHGAYLKFEQIFDLLLEEQIKEELIFYFDLFRNT